MKEWRKKLDHEHLWDSRLRGQGLGSKREVPEAWFRPCDAASSRFRTMLDARLCLVVFCVSNALCLKHKVAVFFPTGLTERTDHGDHREL